ncbi:hypothetical protein UPYG_G00239570 [Umbra pygmaea]|uniref:Type I cytokine receptor cytokine-binding domain-containing protein n=1 Tax=Umbra pygmaea TaxID=75934 RepID=A0ABD0X5I3_UMBPY
MYSCWAFFVTYNLVSFVASTTELSSPINLTFSWTNEFCWKLSWSLPASFEEKLNCSPKYQVNLPVPGKVPDSKRTSSTTYETCAGLTGVGNYSVETLCNTNINQPAVHTIAAPKELVSNFQCVFYSYNDMNCSWHQTSQTPDDLQFYYAYPISKTSISNISMCNTYLHTAEKKTGCHLSCNNSFPHDLFIQVNGTVNGSLVRNTFKIDPKSNVKPPAPKVKIRKEGMYLNLSWDHPNIRRPHCWKYLLNYSRCQEPKICIEIDRNSKNILYEPECQFEIQVKAIFNTCGTGESDWSEVELYGKNVWPVDVGAIVIPIAVFIFVILFLCCFMKHRKKLYPKIPQPSLVYKDRTEEQKIVIGSLYVPDEKVELNINLENKPPLSSGIFRPGF